MSAERLPFDESFLKEKLKSDPTTWETRRQLAHGLYDKQEYEEAAEIIWTSEQIPSTDLDIAFAVRILAKAQPRRAIRLLTAVLELNQGKAVQNLAMANALLHNGLVLQAARFYGAALEADPTVVNPDLEHFILWSDDECTMWGLFEKNRPKLGQLPWMIRDPKEAMKLTSRVSLHTTPISIPNLPHVSGEQIKHNIYQQEAAHNAKITPPPAVTIPIDRVDPKDRLYDAQYGASVVRSPEAAAPEAPAVPEAPAAPVAPAAAIPAANPIAPTPLPPAAARLNMPNATPGPRLLLTPSAPPAAATPPAAQAVAPAAPLPAPPPTVAITPASPRLLTSTPPPTVAMTPALAVAPSAPLPVAPLPPPPPTVAITPASGLLNPAPAAPVEPEAPAAPILPPAPIAPVAPAAPVLPAAVVPEVPVAPAAPILPAAPVPYINGNSSAPAPEAKAPEPAVEASFVEEVPSAPEAPATPEPPVAPAVPRLQFPTPTPGSGFPARVQFPDTTPPNRLPLTPAASLPPLPAAPPAAPIAAQAPSTPPAPTQPIVTAGEAPTQPIAVAEVPTQPLATAEGAAPTQPLGTVGGATPTQPLATAGGPAPTQPLATASPFQAVSAEKSSIAAAMTASSPSNSSVPSPSAFLFPSKPNAPASTAPEVKQESPTETIKEKAPEPDAAPISQSRVPTAVLRVKWTTGPAKPGDQVAAPVVVKPPLPFGAAPAAVNEDAAAR